MLTHGERVVADAASRQPEGSFEPSIIHTQVRLTIADEQAKLRKKQGNIQPTLTNFYLLSHSLSASPSAAAASGGAIFTLSATLFCSTEYLSKFISRSTNPSSCWILVP